MAEGLGEFGQDLRRAREERGWSRAALAETVNVVPQYIANMENGVIPSLPVFYRVVRACKLNVEKYFFPDRLTELEIRQKELVNRVRVCPEEYLPVIRATVDALIKINRNKDYKNRVHECSVFV